MVRVLIVLFFVLGSAAFFLRRTIPSAVPELPIPVPSPTTTLTPTPTTPPSYIIPGRVHVFQTFNNCGPASLSMLLSYFNVSVSQEELGNDLRPYQVKNGDNDDKSVTLDELGRKASQYGFTVYHRPNGNIDLLKAFISRDLPVVVRTWLHPGEDIGHYRLVRGYDDQKHALLQDDSYQNKDLWFAYEDFDALWKPFSYEYLIIVPKGQERLVEELLGDEKDAAVAWQHAKDRLLSDLSDNPEDMYTLFNLSVASYYVGQDTDALSYFERVENRLPQRMLWYQTEPIQAYVRSGNDERALSLTDTILRNHNRAFSELYILRGAVFSRQGRDDLAKAEYAKALFYNKNLPEAQQLAQ